MGKLIERLRSSDLRFPSSFWSNWSSVNEANEGKFRAMLERCVPITTALEIGTFMGLSASLIAEYAPVVYTIDTIPTQVNFVESLWIFLGVDKKIKRKIIQSSPEKKIYADSLNPDFVFIDGAHVLESVEFDFSIVSGSKNILFHDYWLAGGWPDVKFFVDKVISNGWNGVKYAPIIDIPFALLRKEER